MKIVLLGCGSSSGVPIVGCSCNVCTSPDPRNKRSRASVYVEVEGTQLLIDSSPDMRRQFLDNGLTGIDAILYTHAHADHTHGIDDLRAFNFQKGKPIDAYMDATTLDEIKARFSYAFHPPKPEFGWYRPCLNPVVIEPNREFVIQGTNVKTLPFEQIHGSGKTLGFRIGNFAYSTDVNELPEKSLELLHGLDLWIVDCLRFEKAPTHSHLPQTLEWIAQVKPKQAVLTHMSHEVEYSEILRKLPENVIPGSDGLIWNI